MASTVSSDHLVPLGCMRCSARFRSHRLEGAGAHVQGHRWRVTRRAPAARPAAVVEVQRRRWARDRAGRGMRPSGSARCRPVGVGWMYGRQRHGHGAEQRRHRRLGPLESAGGTIAVHASGRAPRRCRTHPARRVPPGLPATLLARMWPAPPVPASEARSTSTSTAAGVLFAMNAPDHACR